MEEQARIVAPLLEAWDELDLAIKRVQTSLPDQMSKSIADLETQRAAYQTLLRKVSIGR